jgi:hypothetical protein
MTTKPINEKAFNTVILNDKLCQLDIRYETKQLDKPSYEILRREIMQEHLDQEALLCTVQKA